MRRLLTRLEAAEQLGMSETWVKDEIREGHLVTVRLGRMVRIDQRDLDQYIDAHKDGVVKTVGAPCIPARSGEGETPPEVLEKTVTGGRRL